jgi:hypothetical protein
MLPTSRFWAVALLVAIAGAGFAAGGAATSWTHKQRREPRRGYVAYLTDRLDLDSAQADSVRAILQRYRPAMRAVFDQVRPQLDSLRDRMRQEIAGTMSPSQRERYDSLLAQERSQRERGGSPPGRSQR